MATTEAAVPIKGEDTPRGFAFALTAYVMWGFLPFYMKALGHIPAAEIIAHRIVWSVPVAGLILVALRRTADLKAALRQPKMLAMALLTAILISINWGTYVWAISVGRTLDTALGYYINPLFSVFLGAIVLKEKLTPLQIAAIVMAVSAVVVLTFDSGGLPWVSLVLTFSWGFYAFFRKTLPIGPNQGFFLEVLLLTPFAAGYLIYLTATGNNHFLSDGPLDTLLLASAGLVTAVPLVIYANGAKLLKLSTIGIMQYIAPTMIFLIAVFAFGEEFTQAKAIAFPLIWGALVLYTWSMLRQSRMKVVTEPTVTSKL
jgi:chloramphenicol-sensitive protein RarD